MTKQRHQLLVTIESNNEDFAQHAAEDYIAHALEEWTTEYEHADADWELEKVSSPNRFILN